MAKEFKGILAALVTPFDEEKKVNLPAAKKLVRYLIDHGADGFYVGGSTGEAFLMSSDERKALLEAVLEENNGEKLVLAHVGGISTADACDLAVHAEHAGADAISAISPFYYKFNQEEIKQHYLSIVECSELPMFIYNFPNLSGFSLTPAMLDELAKNKRIAGVKFTSNNFYDMERMKHAHPELTIWSGFDEMLLSGLSAGADGAIGSTYNVLMPIAKRVYEAFKNNDIATAQVYQGMINEMLDHSIKHANLKVVRKILEMEGIPVGSCRAPFLPIKDAGIEDAKFIHEKFVQLGNQN